jgi:hypothetical protein
MPHGVMLMLRKALGPPKPIINQSKPHDKRKVKKRKTKIRFTLIFFTGHLGGPVVTQFFNIIQHKKSGSVEMFIID